MKKVPVPDGATIPNDVQLEAFVRESWKIEGLILGSDLDDVMDEHRRFLGMSEVSVPLLSSTAQEFTDGCGSLRLMPGMNVQVGNHLPLLGGSEVVETLAALLRWINDPDAKTLTAYRAHQEYEDLHPFLDGNGRTGRLLWAWMMERDGGDSAFWNRGFLWTWYYQSLSAGR